MGRRPAKGSPRAAIAAIAGPGVAMLVPRRISSSVCISSRQRKTWVRTGRDTSGRAREGISWGSGRSRGAGEEGLRLAKLPHGGRQSRRADQRDERGESHACQRDRGDEENGRGGGEASGRVVPSEQARVPSLYACLSGSSSGSHGSGEPPIAEVRSSAEALSSQRQARTVSSGHRRRTRP